MATDAEQLAGIKSTAGYETTTTIEWAAKAQDLMALGPLSVRPAGMDLVTFNQVNGAIREPFTVGKSEVEKAWHTLSLFGLVSTGVSDTDLANRISNPGSATNVAITTVAKPADAAEIYVQKHGLVGNWVGNNAAGSGTDDTAALNALISAAPAGSKLIFPSFGRFRIDPLAIINKSLIFDFNGCEVITRTQGPGYESAFLRFNGTFSASTSVPPVAKGSTNVTVPNGSVFSVGQILELRDNSASLTHWLTNAVFSTRYSEIVQVAAISGNTLRFTGPVSRDYIVAPELVRQNIVKKPVIKNIGMLYDTDPGVSMSGSQAASLFRFQRTVEPLLENVNVTGWQGSVVQFDTSYRSEAVGGVWEAPFRPNEGGHGHGVRHMYSTDGRTEDVITRGARHTSNYVGANRSGSRNCRATDNTAGSFQTHGWHSVDTYSESDEVVNSGRTGWALGNPEYGYDDTFTISSPRYFGTGRGVSAISGTEGLYLTLPRIRTTDIGVMLAAGTTGAVVDTRGGYIESSAYNIRALADHGEGPRPVGDVTIIGSGFKGTGIIDINIAGDLNLDGVPASRVASTVFSGKGLVTSPKDHGLRKVAGFLPGTVGSASTWETANGIALARVETGGKISKIGMHIDVASGNISVAVYRGTGVGSNHLPSDRVATSGDVACPAAGYREVALTETIEVFPGDFLALSVDNTTASFRSISGFVSELFSGYYYKRASSHPAPPTLPSPAPSVTRMPLLVGIP